MTDNEYTTGGEYPGSLALTACTGCGFALAVGGVGTHCQNCGKPWAAADATSAVNVTTSPSMRTPPRIAPDEVVVPRALLVELRGMVNSLPETMFRSGYVRELLAHLDQALVAASGDDGGTP